LCFCLSDRFHVRFATAYPFFACRLTLSCRLSAYRYAVRKRTAEHPFFRFVTPAVDRFAVDRFAVKPGQDKPTAGKGALKAT
jgi:hypothetical protein